MKKILTLIIGLLVLTPCASFAQPKAKRLIQRAKTHAASERATQRAAKEAVGLQQKRAASLIKRQQALELNELSERFGLRVQERVVRTNSKESRELRKEQLRKQRAAEFLANRDFNLKDAVTQIIDNHPNDIIAALYDMRKLRRKRGDDANPEYFQFFATAYYKKNLKTLTPHMYEFFGQVAKRNSKSLEKDVMLRLKELFSKKHLLATKGLHNAKEIHLRLRYLKNVEQVNDLNFSPDELIFAFEQKITSLPQDFSIGHIHPYSKIIIGKSRVSLQHYDYDLARITEMYKQLLTKDGTGEGMTVVFDQKTRNLAIYSPDKKVWLRITPHEYASPNRLHIHLNEVRYLQVSAPDGRKFNDRVLFNVSIPIFPQAAFSTRNGRKYDLYEKMILVPVYNLDKEKGIIVRKGNIF